MTFLERNLHLQRLERRKLFLGRKVEYRNPSWHER
jgi:hypothetical protein